MRPDWFTESIREKDSNCERAARERQAQLTKPPGSLGRLEDIAVVLAGLQRTAVPRLDTICITIFAADHGIAAEKVSAYPQAVTVEMVKNFARGGAAISVLAKAAGANLEIVNVGTLTDPGPLPGVFSQRVSAGTANFLDRPAMTDEQLREALAIGRAAVQRAHEAKSHLFIGGEMGIGNTTVATALACALLMQDPADLVGPGTGLSAQGVAHKRQIIQRALARHHEVLHDPYVVLRNLGGLEIAALTGAYIACAQLGIPALVDGFISSVAALAAISLQPDIAPWLMYGHLSAEPGHARVLQALNAQPLLQLNMRLGEGSGAAAALPLLRLACALHSQMATFAEAQVSTANTDIPS